MEGVSSTALSLVVLLLGVVVGWLNSPISYSSEPFVSSAFVVVVVVVADDVWFISESQSSAVANHGKSPEN